MQPKPSSSFPIKPILVLLAALVMLVLVLVHLRGLNGPAYWKWAWREPPLPAAMMYLPLLLSAVPLLAVQRLDRRRVWARWGAILALMLSCFAMKLSATSLRTSPPSFQFIETVVQQPNMFSYFTDAVSVKDLPLRDWVSRYPVLMEGFNLHTKSKPPGPVAYWWVMLRLFGESAAPRVGGILLGVLAVLGIPATYLLLRLMLRDESAAFCGASFMSLCPGFVLFFPMMDPAYVLLSCAMIGTWFIALRDDGWAAALMVGLLLAIALFVSFSMLVLGAFMIAMVVLIPEKRLMKDRARVAARQAGIAAGAGLAGCLILWLVIGYNPVATFIAAWHHQHDLLSRFADQRPYPATIWFDLADFALGSGWISVLLVILCLIPLPANRSQFWLIWAAIGQLILVAVAGLLQSETSRVWNFMLPLLMIPIGLEMARWNVGWRIACLAMLALLTAAIHQNMGFLY